MKCVCSAEARFFLATTLFLIAGSTTAHAAITAIKNVNVLDVEAGVLRPGQTVVTTDDKITAVGAWESTTIPDGAKVIDGTNLVAIPGLFDAHVHYVHPESFGPLCIAHGVTFVRDMGGATQHILSIRDQLNKGAILGPEMIATGAIIDGVPPVWPFSEPCDDPDHARAAVRRLAAAGVNQIKVYSMLKKEVHKAAVEEAHIRGLKAVGHVPLSMTLDEAIDVGQDGFEHLEGMCVHVAETAGHPVKEWPRSFRDTFKQWSYYPHANQAELKKLYDKITQKGIAICPTMVVFKGIGEMTSDRKPGPWDDYTPAFLKSFWNNENTLRMAPGAAQTVPHMKMVVLEMYKAGVLLLCGTDLANPNVIAGHSLLEEMELFQDAGIPAVDVIRSATIKPAKFLGVADRLGTIERGKTASMVLLRSNPLTNIRNLREIEGVVLRGKYFDRAELQQMTAAVRKANRGDSVAKTAPTADDYAPKGDVIRKGKYRSKFQGMPAGTESFAISKTENGFIISGENRPSGGMQPPCDVTVAVNRDYVLQNATYKTLSEPSLKANYTVTGNKIVVRAKQGETDQPPQELDIPNDWLFSGPVMAMEILSSKHMKLAVGEKKTYQSVGFGFVSWKLDVTEVKAERLPDEQIVLGEQPTVTAQVYATVFQTPMGEFSGKTWFDPDGIPLKATMKMPFGVFETQLEPAEP